MKYPIVIVRWEDHTEDPSWQTAAEVGKQEPVICTTIGWLVHESKNTIKVCNSLVEDDIDDTVGGTSLIMKKNIVDRWELIIND